METKRLRHWWEEKQAFKSHTDFIPEWLPASVCFVAARDLYDNARKDNERLDRAKKTEAKKKKEFDKRFGQSLAAEVKPIPEIIGKRCKPNLSGKQQAGWNTDPHPTDNMSFVVSEIDGERFVLQVTGNKPFNTSCKETVYANAKRTEYKTVTLVTTHYKKNELVGAKYTFDSIYLVNENGEAVNESGQALCQKTESRAA